MVTGEWHKCANLMPSGAEICNSIAIETAKIAAHEWQSEELIFINVFDRVSHVFDPGPVITEPVIGVLLQAWLVRSGENVWSQSLILEPLM